MLGGVLLLLPETMYYEDSAWSVGYHMFLGSIAALAPVILAASSVDLSW